MVTNVNMMSTNVTTTHVKITECVKIPLDHTSVTVQALVSMEIDAKLTLMNVKIIHAKIMPLAITQMGAIHVHAKWVSAATIAKLIYVSQIHVITTAHATVAETVSVVRVFLGLMGVSVAMILMNVNTSHVKTMENVKIPSARISAIAQELVSMVTDVKSTLMNVCKHHVKSWHVSQHERLIFLLLSSWSFWTVLSETCMSAQSMS